jgi:hypothetical protein
MKKELLQKTQMKGVTMSKQDDLEIFDLIKEGLEDAIEFHKGDRKKGKRTRIEFVEVATFDAHSAYLQ